MENYIEHRKRVKDRFRKEGLENFDERYALELLLFYCVPRKDTRDLAIRLLDHFGSIVQVLEASEEELQRVSGVGEGITTFLMFLRQLQSYYETKRVMMESTEPLLTPEAFGRILKPKFLHRRNEVVYVLCLDAKCKLLSCQLVGEGSVNSANISVRKIVEVCLNNNATSVVLAHNHPGGLAFPSPEDIETTIRVGQALKMVDISLLDHLIFADGDHISLVQSSYVRSTDIR